MDILVVIVEGGIDAKGPPRQKNRGGGVVLDGVAFPEIPVGAEVPQCGDGDKVALVYGAQASVPEGDLTDAVAVAGGLGIIRGNVDRAGDGGGGTPLGLSLGPVHPMGIGLQEKMGDAAGCGVKADAEAGVFQFQLGILIHNGLHKL